LICLAVAGLLVDLRFPGVTWIFGLAILIMAIGQFWLFRCLRCRKSLAPGFNLSRSKFFNPIKYCPYCGVDLDETVQS
jgi:hypothetical protein